jgi:hypothetical protein
VFVLTELLEAMTYSNRIRIIQLRQQNIHKSVLTNPQHGDALRYDDVGDADDGDGVLPSIHLAKKKETSVIYNVIFKYLNLTSIYESIV